MKPIEVSDFSKVKMPSSMKASPDGKTLCFCLTQADIGKNKYESFIWKLDPVTGKRTRLTSGGNESSFFWDGNDAIVYSGIKSEADKKLIEKGEELTVYHRLSLTGGEPTEYLRVPANVTAIEEIGKDLYIMTVRSDLSRPDLTDLKGDKRDAALKAWMEEEDYKVCDELPFWFDGRGFVNKIRSRLAVFDARTGMISYIMEPEFDVSGYVLSPDKRKVVFIGAVKKVVSSRENGLYIHDLVSGITEAIVPQSTWRFGWVDYFGDELIVTADDYSQGYHSLSSRLYTCDIETGAMTPAFYITGDHESSPTVDCAFGGGFTHKVAGDTFYILWGIDNHCALVSWKKGEEPKVLTGPDLVASSFEIIGGSAMIIASEPGGLREIQRINLVTGKKRAMTSFNRGIFGDKYVGMPKPTSFINDAGVRIDGWVIEPINYDPGKKYPGILEVHGGPRGAYGGGFFHEMQVLASGGCFVFFCNPRGSGSRGEEFAHLDGIWGTIDYDDVMAFTDHVLKEYPAIDPKRLGITGGSYGGFMTNWVVGHTDRFAAAASCRSMTNLVGFFGVSDISYYADAMEQGGTPWEKTENLWRVSALKYAANFKTPTLFIHSFEDYRCPMPEAEQMYRAMLDQGVPTRMCLFRGESHGLSRGGKPRHRVRRLEEISGWLFKYLKEENA